MAKALRDHVYFRTSPLIPVLVEDEKDIFKQIENAGQRSGAFVVVKFDQSGDSVSDIPGPNLGDCQFTANVVEIPQIWRQKPGPTPSAAEISEAVANILQNHRPTDKDGELLTGGGLVFQSILPLPPDESSMQFGVSFTIGLSISQTSPSR
jgi:hypothetical protein